MNIDVNFGTILGGVILAAILWVARGNLDMKVELATLKTALFGQNGQNGMRGDIRDLKDKQDEFATDLAAIKGALGVD